VTGTIAAGTPRSPGWVELTRRNARSVQTTIGWIYFDPGAMDRYEALGIPRALGYIAARGAPLGPAGPEAMVAAFGSITPLGIALAHHSMAEHGVTWEQIWAARDEAVLAGLAAHAPAALPALERLGPLLWPVVEQLPTVGRTFFAAHLRMARPPEGSALSGWHAVNCLREWRGDTHWAIVVASGLTGVEASVLHNLWLGYDPEWLPRSRGSSDAEIDAATASLDARGLLGDQGRALRQHLEDETDRLTTLPWELLGEAESVRFHEALEPPCELLLARVDATAGPNYQPGSRIRA
jgi:hypothetical protein